MTRRLPEMDRRIGKRWPSRFLNFLPPAQLWRYLTWRSGGDAPSPVLDMCKALGGCKRILIAAPEEFQDLLVALPVVQALLHEVKDVEIRLLAGPRESVFLGAIFGKDRVMALQAEDFFLGEPHFRDLLRQVQAFRPDMTLNLRAQSPPLLHFLMRSSLAPLRVQTGAGPAMPFNNITLSPGERPNVLRTYLLALQLWSAAGNALPCKWIRLTPSRENLDKAAALLAEKGLKIKDTGLFLWQDGPEREQTALLRETVAALKKEGRSVAVVHGQGNLPGSAPPTPHVAAEFATFGVESMGLLLGFFAAAAGVHGMNGPLLHLAGLCESDVTAHFRPQDEPYDTAFLNPRMRVTYTAEKDATA